MADSEITINKDKSDEITLIAFKYGESMFASKSAFYGDTSDKKLPFGWLFYLIKYKGRNILVDTGIGDLSIMEKFGFKLHKFIEPINLLKEYGIKPEDITDLIITHADFDHIGDISLYENASKYIQEDELKRLSKNVNIDDKYTSFNDTIKLFNKFTVKKIGGHTIGSSIIIFEHEDKKYVLAGDECYIHANIERQVPSGRFYNLEKCVEFVEQYSLPEYEVLLCHEPSVVRNEVGYEAILP